MLKKVLFFAIYLAIFNYAEALQKIGFFNGIGYDLKLETYESELQTCFVKNSTSESDKLIPKGLVSYFNFNNVGESCNRTVLFRLDKNIGKDVSYVYSSFLGYNPNAINILNRIEYKLVPKNTFLYPSISGYSDADIILSVGQSGF